MVEVDGDGGVRLSDGHSCTEISRHLEEAEGGRRGEGGRGGGAEVIICQAGAQVGGEVDAGQQTAIRDVIHSWRSQLKTVSSVYLSFITRRSVKVSLKEQSVVW